MRLLADYHIHSKFSRFFHGKNTIEELARTANAMGLQEIAITDHGFKHLFGTNKQKIKKAREIIDEINEWSSTKVLLGMEADIIAEDGTLDIDNETLAMLDILMIGYHKMIKTDFASYFGKTGKSDAEIQKCTNAYLNAIQKYPVKIISHLDSILTTDLYQIGRACKQKGVFIEINNRHTKWTKDQVDELIASDCLFVVCSDAHSREMIGEVDNAFKISKKYEIPTENIANVEFTISEKSESAIELDAFYGMYKQKIDEKLRKQEALEEKRRVEFTESLSPEMEKALREIAAEKGVAYGKEKEEDDTDDWFFGMPMSEFNLIKEAQEYQRKNSMNEIARQNENVAKMNEVIEESAVESGVSVETASVDEQPSQGVVEQPFAQMRGFDMAASQVQEPINPEIIDVDDIEEPQEMTESKVSDIVSVIKEVTKEAQQETASAPETQKVETAPETGMLNFAVKNATKATKVAATPKSSTNITISRTTATKPKASTAAKTSANKPVINVTKPAEPKKEVEPKPAPKKTTKSRGGFMNNINGLVDNDKK